MAPNKNAADSFWFRYTLSCCAATVAESATYPLDMVKTRLQVQGELIQRIQERVSSSLLAKRGFIGTMSGIVKEEGLLKLWQGVTPAVVRHFGFWIFINPLNINRDGLPQLLMEFKFLVYTGVRIITYETLRDKIFKHKSDGAFPLWEAMCSGMTSGAFAQFLASPTDLIKVQMQMEGRRRLEGHPPRVRNSLHALRLLWSEGGIPRLWKGCIPNCQRAALVNMADLATYDKVKHTILRKTNLQDNYITHSLSSACSGLTAAIVSTPADVVKTRIMNQPTDANGKLSLSSMHSPAYVECNLNYMTAIASLYRCCCNRCLVQGLFWRQPLMLLKISAMRPLRTAFEDLRRDFL